MSRSEGAFVVRTATAADADGLARVHQRAWQAAYGGILPDDVLAVRTLEQRRAEWIRELEAGAPARHSTLVAEADGAVVGFARVGPTRDFDLDAHSVGELFALNVDPGCWRQGVGRALLAESVRALREAGFSLASLWVLAENERARRFYEALGWQPDDAEKPFETTSAKEVRYRTAL